MLRGTTKERASATIGRHFAATDIASLPPATVAATRRALLDAYGVMLAATGLAPDTAPFRARVIADGGRAEARILGSDARVPATAAAFANGALGHALDFGDTFDAGPAHPNAALVPALLALADADPTIDGGQLIAAMALGSDLACRISLAPARPYEEGGWYPPPFGGMIGAAAACAKLIGLDADGIVQAIGLALCQASFPGEIKYDPDTRLRGLREAFAARSAVSAALLARDGVRGFAAPLEGKGGFFALHGGGMREDVLLADLGTRFLGDQVSFKPWPSCRGTHAYIEAALALRERIGTREIAVIEAETGPIQEMLIAPLPAKAAPASAIDAKFSIPFTTAAALVHGAVTIDSFGPESLADREVLAIAARVVARANPSWGRAEAASGGLTIELADGERLSASVPQAAGHPDRPMSEADLIAKFTTCAARAAQPIDLVRAQTIAAAILSLGPNVSAASIGA
jgi:2-methylcitrate dehydratase PrpD